MKEQSSPAFKRALAEYERIASLHGEDSEQAINAFMKVFELSPEYIKQEAHAKAKELDLIPPISGYSDDGEPLYSAADIAAKLGIDESEVISRLDELGVYQGNINRIQ